MDGHPPIAKTIFLGSKYSILLVWAATVVHSWGISLAVVKSPQPLKWSALSLWGAGFALLFAGRFELGDSFRIGSSKERTNLRIGGLFRFSRNPMYVGIYATLLASVLYTLNPFVLLIGVFVVIVHHKIVLAEERHLQTMFGEQYAQYCSHVRRYF